MKFDQFPNVKKSWAESQKEKEAKENDFEKEFQAIKEKVREMYERDRPINTEEIAELRELISELPNLVINFDDTITQPPLSEPAKPGKKARVKENQSIIYTKKIIGDTYPEKQPAIAEFAQRIGEPNFQKVQFFYERIASGLPLADLETIYDKVAKEDNEYKEVRINKNFFEVCRQMKETRGVTKVPLLVLSLNTPNMIEKFYEHNQSELDAFEAETGVKVEVLAIIGNQIRTDSDNKIIGAHEHVTDENKKDYIPDGVIMMADRRESSELIEEGVNAVNIQDEVYDPEILERSLQINDVASGMHKHGLDKDQSSKDMFDDMKANAYLIKRNTELIFRREKKDVKELSERRKKWLRDENIRHKQRFIEISLSFQQKFKEAKKEN